MKWAAMLMCLVGCGGASVQGIDPPSPPQDLMSSDADTPETSPRDDATPPTAPDAGPVLPPGCVELTYCECLNGKCSDHYPAPPVDAASSPSPPQDAGQTFPTDGCVPEQSEVARCADSGVQAPGPFYFVCAWGTVLPTAKCVSLEVFRGEDGGPIGESACCP
jgi:hypothetical protein